MEPQQTPTQNNQPGPMPPPQQIEITPPAQGQSQPPPVAQQTGVTTTKKIPAWLRVILGIIIVLVVLTFILILSVGQATKNAVKVSNQFVADVQANNDNAAYGLTTSGFKHVDTEAQLTEIVSGVSPALQGTATVAGRAINKVSGRPDQAIIVYSIKDGANTNYIRIVLQDNKPWQVLNFRSSTTPLSTSSAD